MRITLTRHGGLLAGMKRPPRIIDVTSLDPERAERLRALVARAIGAQRDRAEARSAKPDAMSYSIAVEDDGQVTTLTQTEPTEPSPFADLLEFLETLA
jgi:emfourin